MIVVLDYGRGNLFSLTQALKLLEVEHRVSAEPNDIDESSAIILPGVGAFGDAGKELRNRGLFEPLRRYGRDDRPLLGICVGCQLLMTSGIEFGDHEGLDIIPGTVQRLPSNDPVGGRGTMRIPNVGWRTIRPQRGVLQSSSTGSETMQYFVHSFAPYPTDFAHISATTNFNGHDVPIAVERGNVLGVQFHLEKSAAAGLRLLKSVVQRWTKSF
ncbi:MAG: imidazole glycerol phosphate synthase subunit HisH [Pirellulaceae bacterium]|jgi:glutamine amidotransferase|nr:imidazole glycerol phosphate synthase subunit HisH [Pirellulaceae bacterium]